MSDQNNKGQNHHDPDFNINWGDRLDKLGMGHPVITGTDELLQQAIAANEQKKETTGRHLRLKKVKEIPCLIEPIFHQTGLACLAGSSDTGKSSILRQLAIAIVTGEKAFLDFKINAKHRSVIFVSTEDAERETSYLLMRQSEQYHEDLLEGLRFIFETPNLYDELDNRLTNKPADLVILDCFADAFGGDLKDTQRIRAFLHPYQELATKHQCLFLFLHHTGKRTENFEPNKNNLLGGQGFEAKMRLVIELRVDTLNPRLRHLCVVKGNYLGVENKRESYVLEFDEATFTFCNTGERMPFELLINQQGEDTGKAKFEQAWELKKNGLRYDQIASKMGYSSKGTVAKLFDKARKNGWIEDSADEEGVNGEVPF